MDRFVVTRERTAGETSDTDARNQTSTRTGRRANNPPGESRAAAATAAPTTTEADHAAETSPRKRAAGAADQALKNFVLDTNVLLHDANALFAFNEHNVIIPFAVIEELDTFKKGNDDIGRSARVVIRHLDRLRRKGPLLEGVAWDAADAPPQFATKPTGTIRIDISDSERPAAIQADKADNRIIAVAYHLQRDGARTIFVTKDINARIKADALGIHAEDYENQKIDAEQLYTGFVTVDTPGDLIDELYDQRMLTLEQLNPHLQVTLDDGQTITRRIDANQFVLMRDATEESHSGLARRLADTDHLIAVTGPRKPVYGVLARNSQQTMALDLLLDDEVKLVTLTGGAGTGKTLLALAAGMAKVFQEEAYDRLLVARPIMPMGRDIGYLPGDKDEKLSAWMQPIFDNLDYLVSARGSQMQHAESRTTEQRIE
ncbi:MAG: PIN domain-containing protein, partial [Planctomycetota bacterium]|nr:PIN domain-containing protein [Planctomycetota bacterium]